jgi:hypothetical protein
MTKALMPFGKITAAKIEGLRKPGSYGATLALGRSSA